MMNHKPLPIIAILMALLLISACGANASAGPTNGAGAATPDTVSADTEILIIIDQTPKPITGKSFDFVVKQIPEGYALAEMQWESGQTRIVNSVQEAIEHGGNGEDGFYMSGDGQFSGFFYPDDMKGQEGRVTFLFKNEQGHELAWSKQLTL